MNWEIVTNTSGIIGGIAAVATLGVAWVTYLVSKSSKAISDESKQVAVESKEIAERAFNLEYEEPWKLTPIPNEEGYWILERIHRKFATIYGYCLLPNAELQKFSSYEMKDILPTEIEIIDFVENLKRPFARGSKIIVRIPKVPVGSHLYLYFRDHHTKEEANKRIEENIGLIYIGMKEMPSDVNTWQTPIY